MRRGDVGDDGGDARARGLFRRPEQGFRVLRERRNETFEGDAAGGEAAPEKKAAAARLMGKGEENDRLRGLGGAPSGERQRESEGRRAVAPVGGADLA